MSEQNPLARAQAHTQGPWALSPNGDVVYAAAIRVDARGEKYAPEIARVVGVHWGEGKANARLIAAAPDLLAALQEMREANPVYSRPIGSPGSLARQLQDRQIAAAAMADAAIAKATSATTAKHPHEKD